MKSFYSGLDCLVVPSLWEPQGLVEIEAQALGVPVIVSNVEALNEIIHDGENGLLLSPATLMTWRKRSCCSSRGQACVVNS